MSSGSPPIAPTSRPPASLAPAPIARAPACTPIAAHCDHAVADDDARALVERRCFKCHGAGGLAHHDFTSLDALRGAPIANMVGTCQMPPDGEPALAAADRALLVAWSACQVGDAGK